MPQILWMFIIFSLTMIIHFLAKAKLSAKNSLSPWNTVFEYVKGWWIVLLTRYIVAVGIFLCLAFAPETRSSLGLPFSLSWGTAILYGLAIDPVIDKACGFLGIEGKLPDFVDVKKE